MKQKYRQRLAEYRAYVEEVWPLAVLDWSESAAQAMHDYESRGVGTLEENNGYAIGKKWIDWQITFWKDEIKAIRLLPRELAGEPLSARLE